MTDDHPLESEIVDQIVEEGDRVFSHSWDSGGPGAGAGVEVIYHWKGKYALSSMDFGRSGPYSSLEDALGQCELLFVTGATTGIQCSLMSSRELAERLHCREDDGYGVEINGEPWVYRATQARFKPERSGQ